MSILKRKKSEDEVREDAFDLEESKLSASELATMQQQEGMGSGDFIPKDMLAYKNKRITPNAQKQFPDFITRDVTLANIDALKKVGGPSFEQLHDTSVTLQLLTDILVEKRTRVLCDEQGQPLLREDGSIVTTEQYEFDEEFSPIRNGILNGQMFSLTSSRAIGQDREAVLDKTAILGKQMQKSHQEKRDGVLGFGSGI